MNILLSSLCPESGTDLQLALYYLKSYLRKNLPLEKPALRIAIEVFDEHQPDAQVLRKIRASRPEILGFSCYLWNIEKTLRICRALKNRDPGILIILGGPEASATAREILKREKAIDLVVRGEGERPFCQVLKSLLDKGLAFSRIKGITFRQGKEVIHNPDQPGLLPVNRIPSPYLDGLIDLKNPGIIDLPLETTRGCLFRCSYCYYHKNFPRVRLFPLPRIRKELQLILKSRPREVYLLDATFNSHPQRAKEILRMFIRYNRGSDLHVELMAELLDEEMAGLLFRARAYNIEIGIQSIHPPTLKAVNRYFDPEKFRRGIGLLNRYGLFYEIQLIDALPFQGYAELLAALDWLYALHPCRVVIFRQCLLPGTGLRQQADKFRMRYDSRPPYHVRASQSLSPRDLARIERLRQAMERLYDSQVFQPVLYAFRDQAKVKISQILEDWSAWPGSRQQGRRYLEVVNQKLPLFLKYLCRKHKQEGIYPQLLAILRRNLPE